MPQALSDRRRADSAHVAGDHLVLYGPRGVTARIAVVVDQLDDAGLRTPLVEDVLTAFPYAELFVVEDRRAAAMTPLAGHRPTLLEAKGRTGRGFFGFARAGSAAPALRLPPGHDIVLRIGDRRARAFPVAHDTLDLTYILALADDAEAEGRLGAGYRDHCALQSADVVWAGSRRLMAALRRRWHVEAQLLYPPAEPPMPVARAAPERRVVALSDGASPHWLHTLQTLARLRADLDVVAYGAPVRPTGRARTRLQQRSNASPLDFLAEIEAALALLVPPGDAFDPRVLWAQAAGIPVIAAAQSAAAELVQGLEHREPTGFVLEDGSEETLVDAVAFVETHRQLWPPDRLMAHALRWSRPRFRRTLKSLVFDAWCAHLSLAATPPEEPAPTAAEVPRSTPIRTH